MAVCRLAVVTCILLLALGAGALAVAPGVWAVLGIAPLLLGAIGLGYALPVAVLALEMTRSRQEGVTVLSRKPLPAEEEKELRRVVELVRGRLGRALHGLDEGPCEVWLCPRARDRDALLRARAVGVGVLGPTVCAVVADDLARHESMLEQVSHSLALAASAGLAGRLRGLLREGLTGWLAVLGATAPGVERGRRMHGAAASLSGGEWELLELLRGRGGSERAALATSFTAFLIGRYGRAAYLSFLRTTDTRPPHIALLLVYRRTPLELESRWRSFLACCPESE